jgi:RNA polymerase sigma-70 factor, ECF subfamily
MNDLATRQPIEAQSWREIEARLRPFVARRVASAADVDDVLQEVFLRLQRGLSSLRDDQRLAPWLFSIARNVVTDHHRRSARHPLVDDDGLEAPENESDEAGKRLGDELTGCVARFVTMLPDDYRQAITLVELDGISQKEAAAMLGISHSGMKSRVQRGRLELRRMFERACALELDARRKVVECEPKACGGCGPSSSGSS